MDTLLRQLKRCITISEPSSSPFHWQSEQMTIKKIIKECSPLVRNEAILGCAPKKIVLSGPSGFLGAHVLDSILDVHEARMAKGLDPGEVILMSSSPGNMMKRLQRKYGEGKMKTIRASRVDYFTQHEVDTWRDQLGSLGKLLEDIYARIVIYDLYVSKRFEGRKGHIYQFGRISWSRGWQAGVNDGCELQGTRCCG